MTTDATNAEASSPLFDAWLAKATRGLCDFAKGQVREEYEDHFAAAYEELRAEGLGEEEAEAAAVQSLGDGGKIRRKLKRIFLTSGEDILLGRLVTSRTEISPKQKKFLLLCMAASVATFLLAGSFVTLSAYLAGTRLWGDAAMVLGCIAAFTMVLARRGFCDPRHVHTNCLEHLLEKRAQFHLASALVMSWLLFSIIAFPPDLREFFSPSFAAEAFGVIWLVLMILACLRLFREFLCLRSISRKLRRHPHKTATSSVLSLRVLVEHSCKPENAG